MPNQFLTLKDATSFQGTSDVVGLVDNIINVAPELDLILGLPIKGISYRARIMTAIGSNAAFRSIGGGVQLSAPSFDRKRFNCFPWDCQMEIGEDLLIEAEAEGEAPFQMMEANATAAMRQKALKIGKQFYLGSANDIKGPPGLIDFLAVQRTQVDSRTGLKIDQVIDAGGNSNNCVTIWFIKQGPQGVHWIFGNGRGIQMNPWRPQRTAGLDSTPANPTYRTAWLANTFGYIGTSMANYHALGAIINIDPTIKADGTYTTPLTDAMIAQLWAKFPITEKPDMALCTQNAAASLQLQRTVTNFVQSTGREWTSGAAPYADFPTTLPTAKNIPLVVTDSILPSAKITLN